MEDIEVFFKLPPSVDFMGTELKFLLVKESDGTFTCMAVDHELTAHVLDDDMNINSIGHGNTVSEAVNELIENFEVNGIKISI